MSEGMGRMILQEIQGWHIPAGSVAIWWLGQASFVLKSAGTTIYVDPYLKPNPNRLVPPPFRAEEVRDADLILCTHDHADHICSDTLSAIACSSPQAMIVVPGIAQAKTVELGFSEGQVVVPTVYEPRQFSSATVTAVPAAHEELDFSQETGYPYLGYIIQWNRVTLYHSGDCRIYEGLVERLRSYKVDLAFLPINGHDWKRQREGIAGNMSYREAGDLAVAAGIGVVVPMHYGMFSYNTIPPGYFVDYIHEYCPEQRIHVMARHEGFVFLKV